jgi:hypothetical protein
MCIEKEICERNKMSMAWYCRDYSSLGRMARARVNAHLIKAAKNDGQ